MEKIDCKDIVFDIRIDNSNSRNHFFKKNLPIIISLLFFIVPWIVIYFFSNTISGYAISGIFISFYLVGFYHIKYPFANTKLYISKEGINLNDYLYQWTKLNLIEMELTEESSERGLTYVIHLDDGERNDLFYLNNSILIGWETKFHRFFWAINYFSNGKKLYDKEKLMRLYSAKRMGLSESDFK